eukprot:PhM_4_TR8099/c0_g2_i1/m.60499
MDTSTISAGGHLKPGGTFHESLTTTTSSMTATGSSSALKGRKHSLATFRKVANRARALVRVGGGSFSQISLPDNENLNHNNNKADHRGHHSQRTMPLTETERLTLLCQLEDRSTITRENASHRLGLLFGSMGVAVPSASELDKIVSRLNLKEGDVIRPEQILHIMEVWKRRCMLRSADEREGEMNDACTALGGVGGGVSTQRLLSTLHDFDLTSCDATYTDWFQGAETDELRWLLGGHDQEIATAFVALGARPSPEAGQHDDGTSTPHPASHHHPLHHHGNTSIEHEMAQLALLEEARTMKPVQGKDVLDLVLPVQELVARSYMLSVPRDEVVKFAEEKLSLGEPYIDFSDFQHFVLGVNSHPKSGGKKEVRGRSDAVGAAVPCSF